MGYQAVAVRLSSPAMMTALVRLVGVVTPLPLGRLGLEQRPLYPHTLAMLTPVDLDAADAPGTEYPPTVDL